MPVEFGITAGERLAASNWRLRHSSVRCLQRKASPLRQRMSSRGQADYGPAVCILGVIDAGLGRKEDAIREGRRVVELLPLKRDPINGAHMIEFFGVIYAWTGEVDLACEQLDAATKIPGTLSYGQLRLYPFWDPLRGNPRFEKIVASLAPSTPQ